MGKYALDRILVEQSYFMDWKPLTPIWMSNVFPVPTPVIGNQFYSPITFLNFQ